MRQVLLWRDTNPTYISIHAPARGATNLGGSDIVAIDVFQSTHPRGVRRLLCLLDFCCNFHFNPRTREGCDKNVLCFICLDFSFQSTHPRGVRLSVFYDFILCHIFQSTHPRGVRPVLNSNISSINFKFQSTHPRGVRQTELKNKIKNKTISIHAPARGAT